MDYQREEGNTKQSRRAAFQTSTSQIPKTRKPIKDAKTTTFAFLTPQAPSNMLPILIHTSIRGNLLVY